MQNTIKMIKNNPTLEGLARIIPDITYSRATGNDLKLTLIVPWIIGEKEKELTRYPLIVFVQGSGWTFPDVAYEIPQLCEYARNGYVVATVTHRNCLEGNPFPAYLQDVKTAIRFLRKNAEEYGIDTKRVGIWGTSSGGNTALLVGLTYGEDRYVTEEYSEYSDDVKCVVDCFGPADMHMQYAEAMASKDSGIVDVVNGLMGGLKVEDYPERLEEMSPIKHVKKGVKYSPFLLLHGDGDTVVSYEQTVKMYQTLLQEGVQAEMICVEKAPHEGSFWSRQVHECIMNFFKETL